MRESILKLSVNQRNNTYLLHIFVVLVKNHMIKILINCFECFVKVFLLFKIISSYSFVSLLRYSRQTYNLLANIKTKVTALQQWHNAVFCDTLKTLDLGMFLQCSKIHVYDITTLFPILRAMTWKHYHLIFRERNWMFRKLLNCSHRCLNSLISKIIIWAKIHKYNSLPYFFSVVLGFRRSFMS